VILPPKLIKQVRLVKQVKLIKLSNGAVFSAWVGQKRGNSPQNRIQFYQFYQFRGEYKTPVLHPPYSDKTEALFWGDGPGIARPFAFLRFHTIPHDSTGHVEWNPPIGRFASNRERAGAWGNRAGGSMRKRTRRTTG
jgi:hypothetical protein